MTKGICIIGTDTGVGKTVVTAGLMHVLLSEGHKACYFKPVSSGMVSVGGAPVSTDVCFVKTASGLEEDARFINPFSFETPVSPHLASRIENRPWDHKPYPAHRELCAKPGHCDRGDHHERLYPLAAGG